MKPPPAATAAPPEAGPAPGCLAENLGWLLSQAHYALAAEISAALEPLGITGRSHAVLATAASAEHTQSELAQLVGLDKTTMVVTVDDLERRGLAERRPSKTDRRARVIVVTEAGRRTVVEAQTTIERIQADVLASLPARDRDVFLRSLGELVSQRLCDQAECAPLRRREPKPRS